MNEATTVYARLFARLAGRSQPIRATTRISRTITPVILVAPVRLAGDDRLQAVAYGSPDEEPRFLTLFDPRDPADATFEPLAAWLLPKVRAGAQVWVPDVTSLAVLGIEGVRHRKNPRVSAARQGFARLCYALYWLSSIPGQQHVAVATQVLREHLITGLTPTEDAHLAARLCFDDPRDGVDPATAAAIARQDPGPSLLPLALDEAVEMIRTRVLRSNPALEERQSVIRMLEEGALGSWQLLARAHKVYWQLPLNQLSGQANLVETSYGRLAYLVDKSPAFGVHLGKTREEFRRREQWRAVLEDLEGRGDPIIREQLRADGRAVSSTVLRIRVSARRGGDHVLLVATDQPILRIRPDQRVKSADGRMTCMVTHIRPWQSGRLLRLRVTEGKRQTGTLSPGDEIDWLDTVVFHGREPKGAPWLEMTSLPPSPPLDPLELPADLAAVAERLRTR